MADLLDIAPSTASEAVRIDGVRIVVRGISIDTIATLVSRFPDLKSLVDGGGGDVVSQLIAGCGIAIGPIIAAGCGHGGEEAYERHATTLLPEHQIRLLRAIFGLTFPNGVGSFIQELTNLMGGAGEKAKTVKMRLRKSPSLSQPSSDLDSRPTIQ